MPPPFLTFNHYCQDNFGTRLVKVALSAGAPCPHRDAASGGCTFCNPLAYSQPGMERQSVAAQLETGIKQMGRRYAASSFAAYFQENTTTALPLARLREALLTATAQPAVRMIFVGTRPDFLSGGTLELLQEFNERLPLWVELGIQTRHDRTLQLLNRGHDSRCVVKACERLKQYGIPVVAHMMLGLPGETTTMMQQSLQFLQQLDIAGVKLHHLQVHRNTVLADQYAAGAVPVLELEEYLTLLCELLPWVPPRAVVFRLFAEARQDLLLAPQWHLPKARLIDLVYRRLREVGVRQGEHYQS